MAVISYLTSRMDDKNCVMATVRAPQEKLEGTASRAYSNEFLMKTRLLLTDVQTFTHSDHRNPVTCTSHLADNPL